MVCSHENQLPSKINNLKDKTWDTWFPSSQCVWSATYYRCFSASQQVDEKYQLLSETKEERQLAAVTNPGQRPLTFTYANQTLSGDKNHQLNKQSGWK